MQSSWFRKSRFKSGKGKAIANFGLGYKERPGLGTTGSNPSGTSTNNYSSNESAKPNNEGSTGSNRFMAMRETFKNQYQSQVRLKII